MTETAIIDASVAVKRNSNRAASPQRTGGRCEPAGASDELALEPPRAILYSVREATGSGKRGVALRVKEEEWTACPSRAGVN